MRLIDADKLKQNLASLVVGGEKAIEETTSGNNWIDGIHTAYREINEAPTVDRPHGEWIKDLNGNAHCTNCGLVLDNYIMAVFFNFCPNCGADMREGEAE